MQSSFAVSSLHLRFVVLLFLSGCFSVFWVKWICEAMFVAVAAVASPVNRSPPKVRGPLRPAMSLNPLGPRVWRGQRWRAIRGRGATRETGENGYNTALLLSEYC